MAAPAVAFFKAGNPAPHMTARAAALLEVQPDRAFHAADQLGRQFDVDPLDLKIKAVGEMDKAAWDADSRKRVDTAAMAVSFHCTAR